MRLARKRSIIGFVSGHSFGSSALALAGNSGKPSSVRETPGSLLLMNVFISLDEDGASVQFIACLSLVGSTSALELAKNGMSSSDREAPGWMTPRLSLMDDGKLIACRPCRGCCCGGST
jgi:hypothetical protein